MKKILLFILALSAPAIADINVTQGSGKTVATETNSGREYQQVELVGIGATSTATVTTIGLKVDLSTTNVTGSTVTIVPQAGSTIGVSGTVSVNALPTGTNNIGTVTGSTVTVVPQAGSTVGISGTVTVNALPTGTNNIGTVTGSTVTIVPQAGSTVGVSGTVSVNALPAGTANIGTVTGSTVVVSGLVSTNTLPSPAASAVTQQLAVTPFGQMITVSGVDNAMVKVQTMTVTDTVTRVFISSGGANTYTYLCGCVITNTSATNTFITFFNSGALSNGNSMAIGLPANDVPSGVWSGCGAPFYASAANSAIEVGANASASSLLLTCQYYQSL